MNGPSVNIPDIGKKVYHCGTLTYTKLGLAALFGWLLWGDFCYTIMEAVVPSIVPLRLKDLGCPNWVMGMILTTIPGALGMVVCPWVSFKSDRYRSKWGRRLPFIILTMPFLCISLVLLGWSDDIGIFLRQHSETLNSLDSTTVIIILIALFFAAFQFFNAFVNSVFWYLFNDVVPPQFLARFLGIFRVVGAGAGALYNFFIFKYAESHMREIFTGAAILYFIGFGIVCFMIKEGEYPPIEGEVDRENKGWGGLRTFFKESFSTKFYWLIFLFSIVQSAGTSSIGGFMVFFQKDMGLSLDQIGKMGAISGIAALVATYFAAIFADRWHPLRVLTYSSVFSTLGYFASMIWLFISIPADFYFWLSISGGIISSFQGALTASCFLPFYMRVFPQSRFGQFCSAMSMLRTFVCIGTGMIAGLYIDLIKYMCGGSDYAYRFIFVWLAIGSVISAIAIILVYRAWYRLGGDAGYRAPAPWNANGFEEMPIPSVPHPKLRWLNISLNLFKSIMILSSLAVIPLTCWMYFKSAQVAFFWHITLVIPLSFAGWFFWTAVEKSIRKDIERSLKGEPLRNGIPHHGVLIVSSIKYMLSCCVWIIQIIVCISMKMENAATAFGILNVAVMFMLTGAVLCLAKIERGNLTTFSQPSA